MRVTVRTRLAALVIASVVTAATSIAIAQSNARDLFERGRLLEENAQTLEQAVRAYEQAVVSAKTDRALAAEARLQIARIRERQGKPEARTLFAEIVKAYADQPAVAAAAQARLTAAPADIVARRVWSGPGANADGRPSADGRFLTYLDWSTEAGNVGIRDLTTGENRLLTHAVGDTGHGDAAVLSPDNTEVAYIWNDAEIRLVRFDGSRDRLLLKPDDAPRDLVWSPDGRQLAIVLTGAGQTQRIALVPVNAKPSLVTLKSTGWNFPELGGFSPDGKTLLYSLPHTPPAFDGGIFLLATDGSFHKTVVQSSNEDRTAVWTPDGRGIAFISDRSGKPALWHVRVRNGASEGEPQLLRADIGELNMGFTRDGSYFYGTRNIQRDAYVVKVDPATLTVQAPPARLTDRFVGSSSVPAFSPDGTRVAFMGGSPTLSLVIRTIADNSERILPTRFASGNSFGPEWFADGRGLLVGETDYPNRRAVFRRIDAETGADTPFFTTEYTGIYGKLRFSADGRSLFYSFRTGGDLLHLMRRDLATGRETDLYQVKSDGVGLFAVSLSPDGKSVAFNLNVPPGEGGDGPRAMRVLSLKDGSIREVMRGPYSCPAPTSAAWSRDGSYLLAICDDGRRRRLRAVPSDGGPQRKLDIVMDEINDPVVSPDGRTIAFTARTRKPEVWTVANLLSSVR
jgi:Tol biopolymer transport system component/exonuclease VII small subunit